MNIESLIIGIVVIVVTAGYLIFEAMSLGYDIIIYGAMGMGFSLGISYFIEGLDFNSKEGKE